MSAGESPGETSPGSGEDGALRSVLTAAPGGITDEVGVITGDL